MATGSKPHRRAGSEPGPAAVARRLSLVDAGWELLVTGGPKAVTIDAVLHEVGATRPVFYRHFSDRIDLLVTLYQRYADDMVRSQEPILFGEEGSIEQLLQASTTAYFDLVQQHGAVIRPLAEVAADDPRMMSARALLRERLLTMWEGAVLRRLTPDERDTLAADPGGRLALTTMLELLQATSHDGATLWLAGRAPRPLVEDLIRLLVTGLETRLADYVRRRAGSPA